MKGIPPTSRKEMKPFGQSSAEIKNDLEEHEVCYLICLFLCGHKQDFYFTCKWKKTIVLGGAFFAFGNVNLVVAAVLQGYSIVKCLTTYILVWLDYIIVIMKLS